MKKILIILFITGLVFIPLTAPVPAAAAGSCAYCGQYFIFSDSNPYGECQARMFACWDADGPDAMEACMCGVERDLDKKYTREALALRELAYWIGLLTQSAGVSVLGLPGLTPPGLAFMDPKQREYLLSNKARAHERIGALLGGLSKPPVVKELYWLSKLGDERTPAYQRATEGFLQILPDGHPKTGLKFVYQSNKYWQAVKP